MLKKNEKVLNLSEEGSSTTVNINKEKSIEQEATENESISELTVREAINRAIAEEMRRDEDVFLMGEEVGDKI